MSRSSQGGNGTTLSSGPGLSADGSAQVRARSLGHGSVVKSDIVETCVLASQRDWGPLEAIRTTATLSMATKRLWGILVLVWP